MATLKLPTFPSRLDHRYTITLDRQTITLEWHWNRRAGRWTLHMFDVDGEPVRHGLRLVLIDDLAKRIALATKPPGTFPVVDTSGADAEPDVDNLGGEAQLRYVES